MRRVVCPGSFDPITNGHLDIIERASSLFDEVVIAVLVNQTKSSLFTVDERIEMIKEVTAKYKNVRVDSWSGLLVDYCKANQISTIVKGLRAVSDFDYELQMSQVNLATARCRNIIYGNCTISLLFIILTCEGDRQPRRRCFRIYASCDCK
jgi:pantetheine-phosphate adenylyltransferase